MDMMWYCCGSLVLMVTLLFCHGFACFVCVPISEHLRSEHTFHLQIWATMSREATMCFGYFMSSRTGCNDYKKTFGEATVLLSRRFIIIEKASSVVIPFPTETCRLKKISDCRCRWQSELDVGWISYFILVIV